MKREISEPIKHWRKDLTSKRKDALRVHCSGLDWFLKTRFYKLQAKDGRRNRSLMIFFVGFLETDTSDTRHPESHNVTEVGRHLLRSSSLTPVLKAKVLWSR
ncbi:uncharacterized protein LJ206_003217 [Theristicus caerulescens]